jgi:cytochrome P450 PksS
MTVVTARLSSLPYLDTSDHAFRANPYPTYARLRRTAPLARTKLPMVGPGWVLTRYDDVAAALKDPRFSNDSRQAAAGTGPSPKWLPRVFRTLQSSMITVDDPEHARLRNLVHQAFTPRRIQALAARIEAIVDELLDAAGRKRQVDLLADFALPLPLIVISEMLGVPPKDRLKFHHWTGPFLEGSSSGLMQLLTQLPNGTRLLRFFETLIRQRRADPQDDLTTALVNAELAGNRLSEDELISMLFLLLLAGHETTVNLIANGTLALMEHPDQMQRLHAEPPLIDTAVEELLRYGNPVEHGNMRYLSEDVELYGTVLPRGSMVVLMLSSANRDESVFPDPDRLDLSRTPNRHLAFGLGVHYCLGAPLARLEGKIALRALSQRYPGIRLAVAPEQLRWRIAIAIHGLKALPVMLAA